MTVSSRVRVTFDDQIYTGQAFGGVSRYFTEVISQFRLDSTLGIDAVTPFTWVKNEGLILADPAHYRLPSGPAVLRRGAAMRVMNAARFATPLRRAEILHHTYFLPAYLRLPARRRVCTVYDMIPEILDDAALKASNHAKERFARECDAVLCISHTTKADLFRFYGTLDKPVEVTPLAVSEDFFKAMPDASEFPYIAFVGRRHAYKNFDVVLRAFALIAGEHPDVRLMASGGGPFTEHECERINALGLSGRVIQRNLAEAELPSLYANALAMVFPSYYEGFGLPILEGFAARCPVVVADTPCSIEVSGGAAEVFAPDDDERLAGILTRLITDPVARARLVEAGSLRARDFSWHKCASLTAEVYRRIDAQW